jgi:hypothetical protein
VLHVVKEKRNIVHSIIKEEDQLDWSRLAKGLLSETLYLKEDRRMDRSDGKTRKKKQSSIGLRTYLLHGAESVLRS